MRAIDDSDARQAIQHALDETLVVEAVAGTGKTTEVPHGIDTRWFQPNELHARGAGPRARLSTRRSVRVHS